MPNETVLGAQAPNHDDGGIVNFVVIIIFIDWIARRVKDWLGFQRKTLRCTEFYAQTTELDFKLLWSKIRNCFLQVMTKCWFLTRT